MSWAPGRTSKRLERLLRRRLDSWRRALDARLLAHRVSRWRRIVRTSGKLVIGVTGSVGKTTTCQMLAHILAARYPQVARSTTQGTWIGRERLGSGDSACGWQALALLADRRSEAGVCELARGGIIKWGMGLEALDVGVVLNVLDNHLGLNGIHTRADMARVKRVVVEKATHMALLNADDPLVLAMRPGLAAARIALVSMDAAHPELARHAEAGGVCAARDGDRLRLWDAGRPVGAMAIRDIPASLEGRFRPGIASALFAMTAAHGAGVDFQTIRARLSSFESTPESNPGRMNFFPGLPFELCLTDADGPQAVAALAEFFRCFAVPGRKLVMFTSAGNRPDDYISAMAAEFAPVFDRFVCCDWNDLRGRAPGETARLLGQGLARCGVESARVHLASDHAEALRRAFDEAAPGDLLLIVTSGLDTLLRLVAERRRAPAGPLARGGPKRDPAAARWVAGFGAP